MSVTLELTGFNICSDKDRANELKEKELLIGDKENTKDSPNIGKNATATCNVL